MYYIYIVKITRFQVIVIDNCVIVITINVFMKMIDVGRQGGREAGRRGGRAVGK